MTLTNQLLTTPDAANVNLNITYHVPSLDINCNYHCFKSHRSFMMFICHKEAIAQGEVTA